MEDLNTVKKDLKALFRSQNLAVLATQEGDRPYLTLVAFVSSEDLRYLLFTTTRSTRKYANLSASSGVAMLVDNRSNEPSDFRWAMAVTATGKAEEIDRNQEKELFDAYLAKHPHLQEFATSPTCAFVRIRVDTYYVVTRFQKVLEVHVNP
ncbi:MAG: pyridoxamine 5'-phosphate oxidase family protein [Deltaproteobacteria bacterium]|nr:pyridoxamine 5'-phosphate oxidase family protein [Deltaproteobacteria bacterium]